jgi:hypothetical protein
MFLADEILLQPALPAAGAGLGSLGRAGLAGAARDAWGGDAQPARPELARIQSRELARGAGSAGLAIRWETAGPDGSLHPVLDADLDLISAAGGRTRLTLTGAYRPVGRESGEMAAEIIRLFLSLVAARITDQPGPGRSLGDGEAEVDAAVAGVEPAAP